jgi:predicted N-formylglutamate amidohydrolase
MPDAVPAFDSIVVTCEHASNRVPAAYRAAFADAGPILATHRGYDIGALEIARLLARACSAPLFAGRATRLLVDLNRSADHPRAFSEYTRSLAPALKQAILARYYHDYREPIIQTIDALVRDGRQVLHLSVHSFTPRLGEHERRADIALLYDPKRARERALCDAWKTSLCTAGDLRVRRNYPYRGDSDGFTTTLRRRFDEPRFAGSGGYAGIEIESNQRHTEDPAARTRLAERAIATLDSVLGA